MILPLAATGYQYLLFFKKKKEEAMAKSGFL